MIEPDEPMPTAGPSREIGELLAHGPNVAGGDVYLGPHCDDVCFSLGAHTHRRRSGVLLTVCPVGGYIATPGKTVAEITDIRFGEEVAFARSCGLVACHLRIEGASVLRHDPFDASWLVPNTERIERRLLEALRGLGAASTAAERPWLFCPGGIGGHIDHLAVRGTVLRHAAGLAELYRLSFYEDLPYASVFEKRCAGIADLMRALEGPPLRRFVLPVADQHDAKLTMLRLYPSQLPEPPQSLAAFTPSAAPATAHEAVWTVEAGDFAGSA